MKRICVFAAVVAVLLACTAPLYAQPERDALQMVPDDALGFVIINRLGETNDKLAEMTKRMQIPLPFKPLDFIKLITGVQKGINEKGSIVAAAFDGPREGSEPSGVLYIPVSDYKEFVEQLSPKDSSGAVSEAKIADKAILVAKKNGFALISPAEDRNTLMKALKSTKSIAGATVALDAWITQNDIAGVMTPRGMKTVVAIATKKLEEERGKLDNLPPEAQFIAGMYDGIVGFVKGVGTDVTLAGIGGRIDQTGNLHIDARAVFAKGSNFAKFGAASAKAPEGGPLAGLPAG